MVGDVSVDEVVGEGARVPDEDADMDLCLHQLEDQAESRVVLVRAPPRQECVPRIGAPLRAVREVTEAVEPPAGDVDVAAVSRLRLGHRQAERVPHRAHRSEAADVGRHLAVLVPRILGRARTPGHLGAVTPRAAVARAGRERQEPGGRIDGQCPSDLPAQVAAARGEHVPPPRVTRTIARLALNHIRPSMSNRLSRRRRRNVVSSAQDARPVAPQPDVEAAVGCACDEFLALAAPHRVAIALMQFVQSHPS